MVSVRKPPTTATETSERLGVYLVPCRDPERDHRGESERFSAMRTTAFRLYLHRGEHDMVYETNVADRVARDPDFHAFIKRFLPKPST